MNLIILAAGRGSRLIPLTNTLPKCMVKVGGKPLLDYIKEASRSLRPSRIGIVVGYLAEKVKTFDWHVTSNQNWDKTNMIESLLLMDEWLLSDESIVTYSDIFYGHHALISLGRKSQAPISILYSDSWKKYWNLRFEDPLSDAENLIISKDQKVLNISGRAGSMDQIDGQYMGLIKFTPKGWKLFKRKYLDLGIQTIDVTKLLSILISEDQIPVDAIKYSGQWGEIDSLSDLDVYEKTINFEDL